MIAPITYSPKPPNDYRVKTLPTCEVNEILKLDKSIGVGVWNFFWLVNPSIDTLPDSGKDWWKAYKPTQGLLTAVISDVMLDEVLYRRVVSQPHKFCDWWHRQDASIFDVDNVLPDGWSVTVLERAHEAKVRLSSPIAHRDGNVITLNLPKRKVA